MSRIHDQEFKVRLVEEDADMLRALAKRRDVPAAVLMRMAVRRWLRESCGTSIRMSGENRRVA